MQSNPKFTSSEEIDSVSPEPTVVDVLAIYDVTTAHFLGMIHSFLTRNPRTTEIIMT